LRSSNISNGKLIFDNNVFVNCTVEEYKKVKENDIIICVRNGSKMLIGKCAIAKHSYSATWGAFMVVFRGKAGKFIYHIFTSNILQKQIEKTCSATINQITNSDFKQFLIPFPPRPEQQAIAEALYDVDSYIEALEKLIAKKKAIKQGAMQELLAGKRRLPGFAGEWEYKPIKELADIFSGGTPDVSNKTYWNGQIIWITPTDITGQQKKYIYYSERQISELGLNNSSAIIMPQGTLLLCSRATIGEISIAGLPLATNQGFKNLVCFENIDEEFLYYAIKPMKQKMIEQAIGTTFLEISKIALGNIEVFIPVDKAEQTAIAAILSDMDAEIDALTAKLNKAKLIKQGMMQELLTGKIRLVNKRSIQKEFGIFEYMVILAIITNLCTNKGMKYLKHMRYQKLVYLYLVYIKAKTNIFKKWDYGPFSSELAYNVVPKAENEKSYIATDNDKNICIGKNINEAIENAKNGGYYKGAERLAKEIRYKKDTELEVLATVVESIRDMEILQKTISLQTVKEYIGGIPIWAPKLDSEHFSDYEITKAIREYYDFFK
jgi:type I restriction enzyme S subunit